MNILSGLTAIFIILKVFGIIDWDWWIVLSPAIVEVTFFGIIIWIVTKIFNKLIGDDTHEL